MKLAISGKGGVGKSTLAAALSLLMAKTGSRVLAVDAAPDANLASALGIPAQEQQSIIPISEQIALIEERTGAKVKQYGQMFKLNPRVSDIAGRVAYTQDGISLLVLGAIEHLGRATAREVDRLIVVVAPGQRSIDSAFRVQRMSAEIGLDRISFVANKIQGPKDEIFDRTALTGDRLIGLIPYHESLRQADRDGRSVLDGADVSLVAVFEKILKRL
jgi:CO dehydrogenase maturation factor